MLTACVAETRSTRKLAALASTHSRAGDEGFLAVAGDEQRVYGVVGQAMAERSVNGEVWSMVRAMPVGGAEQHGVVELGALGVAEGARAARVERVLHYGVNAAVDHDLGAFAGGIGVADSLRIAEGGVGVGDDMGDDFVGAGDGVVQGQRALRATGRRPTSAPRRPARAGR